MIESDLSVSETVIYTVADALSKDPTDLPPLERTISADALDRLFHPEKKLPGAYTLFPYCDLWVVVHGNGVVNVFEEFVGTSATDGPPLPLSDQSDERIAAISVGDTFYTFHRNDLDELNTIVKEATNLEEAWEAAIAFAK